MLNTLYVELKTEMATAALDGLSDENEIRQQSLHMWSHWLRWATPSPQKRRALAHLDVSDDITTESRQTGHQTMAGIAKLLERSRKAGAMRDVPLEFALAIMGAMANATMDYMIHDPANADKHCKAAFDAFWRMVA